MINDKMRSNVDEKVGRETCFHLSQIIPRSTNVVFMLVLYTILQLLIVTGFAMPNINSCWDGLKENN